MKKDLREKINFLSIHQRKHLVHIKDFAKPPKKNQSFNDFIKNSLPNFLKAKDFKEIVSAFKTARKKNRLRILAMGGHSIKVGLNPILIDLFKKGYFNALMLQGSGIIHDFEIAYHGATSEKVDDTLITGNYGLIKETGEFLNNAINHGYKTNSGLGQSIGKMLTENKFKYNKHSLIYNCYKLKIPVFVFIAIGNDTIHLHNKASGESLGQASYNDFLSLIELLKKLNNKGVIMNLGSAVILPEVFLKALSAARNIFGPIKNFTAINFDMIQHYRPNTNIVKRPTLDSGKGYSITGHHEILIPLLAKALIS